MDKYQQELVVSDFGNLSSEIYDNEKEVGSMQTCRKVLFQEHDDDVVVDKDHVVGDGDVNSEVFEYAPDMNEIHSKLPKDIIPIVGMEFESEETAKQYYNRYSKAIGFGTRLSKSHKDRDGTILDRIFCCSCEGTRGKDKRDPYVRRHRALSRSGCAAMMKISSRVNGKYRVIKFEPQHNHVLSTPSKTHMFRSHRKINTTQAIELDMACRSGITPKASMELLSRQAGGKENLGFLRIDCNNYLRKKREKEMKVGDTGGVLEYLQHDLITNIFWGDARMRSDYDYFGDAVCFDTTYKKNKDGRPFALFVGVNHHKQTIVFGAALLYDETTETFKWLFDTFVKAMHGKKPKTILTDQDQAMANALAIEWPETYHRLCVWHMYQNAAKHLHHVFEGFKSFAKDFSSCVYDHDDELDFINAWETMLQKYNLQDNSWLQRLFDLKEKWALVYGRQTFCADMSTTQRSESMNSQIKRYISYKNHLSQFFEHFERLLNDRRYDEKVADFKSKHTSPALPYPVQILKHATTVYTAEVYELFQSAVWKAWDCIIQNEEVIGTTYRYTIIPPRKHISHLVTYDFENGTIFCSCRKFDFVGILCSHALKILSSRNITKIPNDYILRRWKKDAKVGNFNDHNVPSAPIDEKLCTSIRFQELGKLFTHFAGVAAESEETYRYALDVHQKALTQVEECLKKLICGNEDGNDEDVVVHDSGENAQNEQCDLSKVRGIKIKGGRGSNNRGRGNGRNSGSRRCKSVLEKGRSNKKHCHVMPNDQNTGITDSYEGITPMSLEGITPISQGSQVSYTALLSDASQVCPFGSGSLSQLLKEQMSALGTQEERNDKLF